MRKRSLAGIALVIGLAAPGWAQTAEGQPPTEGGADRTDPVISPPLPNLSPRPQGGWRKSPIETEPYVPLTVKEKVYLFGWRTIQPSSFAKSAFTAGMAHLRDTPEEWGQGWEGYGRRYGHRLANRGVESAIGFGVSSLLGQDARYFRLPRGTVKQRLVHALSQVVITRTDDGGKTFSAWRWAGNYGGQFVSNAWRPERQRGVGDTMLRGTFSLSFDAASNMFKEFWPDIRRRVFRR